MSNPTYMKHYSVGHLCVGTLVAPKEKQMEKKSYCLLGCALTLSKRQTLQLQVIVHKVELYDLVSVVCQADHKVLPVFWHLRLLWSNSRSHCILPALC